MLSQDDHALVNRDPALPGLSILLDGENFVHWIAHASSNQPGDPPLRAKSLYIRYKPCTSCLVLLDVQWPGHSTLMTAACHPLSATDKLAKAKAHAAEFPGIRFWHDDTHMVTAHAFPSDRELPALARLENPDSRSRILTKLFGCAEGTMRSILRYKPERRCVSTWSIAERTVVLKAYAEREFQRVLANALAARASTPEPLAHSERHRLIAWRWLTGSACDESRIPNVAAAIASLHRSHARFATQAEHGLLAAWAGNAAEAIANIQPTLATRASALASSVQRLVSSTLPHAPLHGDCSLDQCIDTSGVATLIDFDNALMGPPELDLGNLAAKCLLSSGDHSAADLLMKTYAHAASVDPRPTTPPFIALGLLRAATDAFRTRQPHWASDIERSLALAEGVIDAR